MLAQPQQGFERTGPQVPWQLRDLGLAGAWVLAAGILMLIVLGIVFAAAEDISDDGAVVVALGATLALEMAFLGAAAWFSVRRYACGWQQDCRFPPSGRRRVSCPRGWSFQDGWCKPYRGY